MPPNHTTDGPFDEQTECGLHSFERNRFFHGKLMTARDMEAEQRYHRNRLRTLAQNVTGHGIVCGLETTVEAEDGSLVVSIEPGLAFDACGHPIVIATGATEELDLETVPDPVSIYVDYDHCVKETVPVPGSEDACEQECTYNRVLEIFELTTEAAPPDERKPVEPIEFPERGDYDVPGDGRDPAAIADADDALRRIAASFAEAEDGSLRQCESEEGHRVFLGRFESDGGDGWTRLTGDVEARGHVYSNDLLYAAIARHAARFDDPHDVTAGQTGALASVDGVSNPGGDVDLFSEDGSIEIEPDDDRDEIDVELAPAIQDRIAGLEDDVDQLTDDVERLTERLDAVQRQLLRSTLQHKRLAFGLVADRFGEETDAAVAVVERVEAALEAEHHRDPDDYLAFVAAAVPDELAVAEELSGSVSESGLRQYAHAVRALRSLAQADPGDHDLDASEYLDRVAYAQGLVAETAEWLVGSTVEPPPPAEPPSFAADVFEADTDEVARIDLTTGDAEAIDLQIGDEVAVEYELRARITDLEAVSELTLLFDTSSVDEGDRLRTDAPVDLAVESETHQRVLFAGDSPLELEGRDADGRRLGVDVATLELRGVIIEDRTVEAARDSLDLKQNAFAAVADQFGLDPAETVVDEAAQALDEGAHETPENYRSLVERVLDAEQAVLRELAGAGATTADSLGVYAAAHEDLRTAVERDADLERLIEIQNRLSEAARRLEPGEPVFEFPLDPREPAVTVDDIENVLPRVETVEVARAMLAAEVADRNRVTAREAIRARIRALEGQ